MTSFLNQLSISTMNHQHQQYYNRINELVLVHLTPVLVNKLEGQVQLIKEAKNSLTDYYTNIGQEDDKVEVLEMLRKMKTLKESLAQSVNSIEVANEDADPDEDFDEYFTELKNYTDALPAALLEYQSLDRFQPFPNDTFRIKAGKRIKKWALLLGMDPAKGRQLG